MVTRAALVVVAIITTASAKALVEPTAVPCDLTGIWQSVGADDPITVIEWPNGTFSATAKSGFTDARAPTLQMDSSTLIVAAPAELTDK